MRPPRTISLLASLAILTLGASASAQDRVTIVGRVVDVHTRLPIPEARVEIQELEIVLNTDAEGTFEVRDAPVGVYVLRLGAPGYHSAEGNFAIMRAGGFVTTLTPLLGEEDVQTGRLVGRVSDAGSQAPIPGVRVRVADLFLDALTDDDGRFAFGSVPPGEHTVEFSTLGYATRRDGIVVRSGQTSDTRVAMAVDAVEVEPITVTVERRELVLERHGFYERRRVTTGDFIDRADIEEQQPVEMVDLFRRINGATIRLANPFDAMSQSIVLRGGRAGSFRDGACYPAVWLDGVEVHSDPSTAPMINRLVNPDQVAGLEVYQGGASMPPQYGGPHAACGVIVIWTR